MTEWFHSKNSFCCSHHFAFGLPSWLSSEDPACSAEDAGDAGSTAGLGRRPGGGHGNPLQYSRLDISWTGEFGELWSLGSQRVRYDWSDWTLMHTHSIAFIIGWATIPICWSPRGLLGQSTFSARARKAPSKLRWAGHTILQAFLKGGKT